VGEHQSWKAGGDVGTQVRRDGGEGANESGIGDVYGHKQTEANGDGRSQREGLPEYGAWRVGRVYMSPFSVLRGMMKYLSSG
jgi:hypothetical protein